jgi:hypothetical protein
MLEVERKKFHNVEPLPPAEDIIITKYEEKTE